MPSVAEAAAAPDWEVYDRISIARPPSGAPAIKEGSPSFILIMGWMNGSFRYVSKYAPWYLERGYTVGIVLSESENFYMSEADLIAKYKGVVTALEQYGLLNGSETYTGPRKSCIIHVFSNGGVSALHFVLRAAGMPQPTVHSVQTGEFPEAERVPPSLAIAGVIADSCPGHGDFVPTVKAFTGSLRNPVVWAIGIVLATGLFVGYRCYGALTKSGDPLIFFGSLFSNPSVLEPSAPQLYLHSAKDDLVLESHIEAHLERLQTRGFSAQVRKWEDSGHVRLMKDHPDEYWEAVSALLAKWAA
ncbi:uncharacterized protein BJ171DRAFT_613696 [Polychytrium aggregatum]|uniref:uncharacterized protein n=1 Tax=Polychytrium aggregatum TaxID=110093 RepID=UPI0022FEF65B|nr:uncharacterized protein BJ171DRAFT_613696 [Polychytrium aggregatum]KAI9205717.1 hypothetical protein BJ171DRAFT_613696 [Polychytrium aggregatum]